MPTCYLTASGYTTVSGIYISPETEARMRTLANYIIDLVLEVNKNKFEMAVN